MDAVLMGSWSCLRDQDYRMRLAAMRLAAEETSGAPACQGQSAIHPAAVKYAIDVICCIQFTVGTDDRNHWPKLFRVNIFYQKSTLSGKIHSIFALPIHHKNHISAETDRTSETNARSECPHQSIPNDPSVHMKLAHFCRGHGVFQCVLIEVDERNSPQFSAMEEEFLLVS